MKIIIPVNSHSLPVDQMNFVRNFLVQPLELVFVHVYPCELDSLIESIGNEAFSKLTPEEIDEKFKDILMMFSKNFNHAAKRIHEFKEVYQNLGTVEVHIILTRGLTIQDRLSEFINAHNASMVLVPIERKSFFSRPFGGLMPYLVHHVKTAITMVPE